jgi:O-antigen ligase
MINDRREEADGVSTPLHERMEKASDWLIGNILPIGWIALLTGMLWVGDRSYYHKLYYVLLLAPTVLAIILHPLRLKELFSSRQLTVFVLFAFYVVISISWSGSDNSVVSLLKRPFYVLFLFFSGGLLALKSPGLLLRSFQVSAVIASLLGVISLGMYLHDGAPARLTGYGALYNSLLSSHVYGYFMAFCLADWFFRKNPADPVCLFSLLVFGALIVATGSRTPLLALAACIAWLAATHWNRRSLVLLLATGLSGALLLIFYSGELFARGASFRPAIWGKTWLYILDAPWFGHGYDTPMTIQIPGVNFAFADPHNLLLGVLYECGLVGLILWLSLYFAALSFAWRNRKEGIVTIASALLVFGLVASMTEGGSFLSRPKEHWFLVWIPMTLLFASGLMYESKDANCRFMWRCIESLARARLRRPQQTP